MYLRAVLAVCALTLAIGIREPRAGWAQTTTRGVATPASVWRIGDLDQPVRALAVSPAYAVDRTAYAITDDAVYRSSDGASTWAAKTAGLPGTGLQARVLAVTPTFARDRTIFLGTEEALYRSTDGGDSWGRFGSGPGMPVCQTCPRFSALAVSPNFAVDQTIFAATAYGVSVSADGGRTWRFTGAQNRSSTSSGWPYTLALSSTYGSDATVYVAVVDGVFRSAHGGQDWVKVSEHGLAPIQGRPTGFALSPAYAADGMAVLSLRHGALRTADGGETWHFDTSAPFHNGSSIAFSPGFSADGTIYAANGDRVWRSTTRGESWQRLAMSGLPEEFWGDSGLSLALSPTIPRTLFLGWSGGVLRFVDDRAQAPPAPEAPRDDNSTCDPGGSQVGGVPGAYVYQPALADLRMLDPTVEATPPQMTQLLQSASPPAARSTFALGETIRLTYLLVPGQEGDASWIRTTGPDGHLAEDLRFTWPAAAVKRGIAGTYVVQPAAFGRSDIGPGSYRIELFYADAVAGCIEWSVG